jgi:hypothetical protein
MISGMEAPVPTGNGRGRFFAVDHRAWAHVCKLGMNPAVAYLVVACGTGGDNRTTKWSANAIERRTGISRSRAKSAITQLEQAGLIRRDPASKPAYPKYRVTPAHELPGCEEFLPPALNRGQQRVFEQIRDGWTFVPNTISRTKQPNEWQRWGTSSPRQIADELVKLGCAVHGLNGNYQAVRHDPEAAAKPVWIWLPNALVEGADAETPPVELVRQTDDVLTLRLLVNLYGAQNLEEDGGIHFRQIREFYARHRVGEQGPYVVWGFTPKPATAFLTAPFVAPHMTGKTDEKGSDTGWPGFWACWIRLQTLGLVEFVGHLVHADTAEGEIIHPMALGNTGLQIEREVCQAADFAAATMLTLDQGEWAHERGVVIFAPVLRHIEDVQMVGIARLRYRPRTNRTLSFMSREAEWRATIARLQELRGSLT